MSLSSAKWLSLTSCRLWTCMFWQNTWDLKETKLQLGNVDTCASFVHYIKELFKNHSSFDRCYTHTRKIVITIPTLIFTMNCECTRFISSYFAYLTRRHGQIFTYRKSAVCLKTLSRWTNLSKRLSPMTPSPKFTVISLLDIRSLVDE